MTRGSRRREAEARCPSAVVADADEVTESRTFEVVARALDAVTPRLAVERPGLVVFPAGGPSRFFGGELALCERVLSVALTSGATDARVGVADGVFAATLAARLAGPRSVHVVPVGETGAFLARQPVAVLGDRGMGDLAGLLTRLGVTTLGHLAALPAPSVAMRFGDEGIAARLLARGEEPHPPMLDEPPPELTESVELDPPAQRVDVATFAAKGVADRLLDRLDRWGLACTRVVVEAETEHGESLRRVWRHDGPFTAAALAQRVRWQLDAWLTGRSIGATEDGEREGTAPAPRLTPDPGGEGTTGGLTLLRLVPDEVVPMRGRQLGFFGDDPIAGDRAARSFARLQGMLGREAVTVPVVQGGRTPSEQVAWVPWGEPRRAARPAAPAPGTPGTPGPRAREGGPVWPGAVPGPGPARVYEPPVPARLLAADGSPVVVTGRGEMEAGPARLECDGLPGIGGRVEAWAGPWVHDARWWDPAARRRCALFQLVVAGVACLVSLRGGEAGVEAVYD